MEATLLVLLGVFGTIIVSLLGFIGVSWRNNKAIKEEPSNPNFGIIELLCKQQIEALGGMESKLDALLLMLKGIEASIAGLIRAHRSDE